MTEADKMTKPVVGIIPLYDEEKDSYWMLPGYMAMLEDAGALPVMLPLTGDGEELDACYAMCDGLLIPGGQDVDPALYGQARTAACGETCPPIDAMEAGLLARALRGGKPVLGICRGIQVMNAVLGGTLYQDLPTELPGGVEHQMTAPYDRSVHTVAVRPDTRLGDILGPGDLPVNSYHHQGVRDLAPGLRINALAPDGLIEAVDLPSHPFFLGVQWHPEFSFESDEASRKIVGAFVRAMEAAV